MRLANSGILVPAKHRINSLRKFSTARIIYTASIDLHLIVTIFERSFAAIVNLATAFFKFEFGHRQALPVLQGDPFETSCMRENCKFLDAVRGYEVMNLTRVDVEKSHSVNIDRRSR